MLQAIRFRAHLGVDVLQPAGQEVGRTHPRFDRAEGVLDGTAVKHRRIGIAAEPPTHGVDQALLFPSGYPAFSSAGSSALNGVGLTFVDPVSPDLKPTFLAGVTVDKFLACRADLDVAFGIIGEVGLHIHACARRSL